jgi:pantothenate kinase
MTGTFREPEELVRLLADRAGTARLLAAIAGPPGSGKSTFAEILRDALNTSTPGLAEVLPMDGYHYDDLLLNARGWRDRKGAPHTFDVGGLRAMLVRLKANEEDEIAVPVFDRAIEIARAGARMIPRSVPIVLVEGNYLLLDRPPWTDLAPLFDQTVMLDAPFEVLRDRLLARWAGFGLTGEALAAKMDGNDLPNVALVQNHSRPADHTLDATRPWSDLVGRR